MKVTVEIKKGYAYAIIGLLILITGILIVNASNYVNPITKVGHDASEVGPGIFGVGDGSWYTFSNPVNLKATTVVGNPIGQQGVVNLLAGSNGGSSKDLNIDNAGGMLRVSNASWTEIFSVANNGDINVKNGAGITLGGVKKTTWPTTSVNIPPKGVCYAHILTPSTSSYQSPQCDPGYTSVFRHRARCDQDANYVAIANDAATYANPADPGLQNGYQCNVNFELCCASSL